MTNMLLISSLVSLMTMSMEGVCISYPTLSTSQLRDANALQVMAHAREEYLFQYVFFLSSGSSSSVAESRVFIGCDVFLTVSIQIIDLRVGEQQFPAPNILPTSVGKS